MADMWEMEMASFDNTPADDDRAGPLPGHRDGGINPPCAAGYGVSRNGAITATRLVLGTRRGRWPTSGRGAFEPARSDAAGVEHAARRAGAIGRDDGSQAHFAIRALKSIVR